MAPTFSTEHIYGCAESDNGLPCSVSTNQKDPETTVLFFHGLRKVRRLMSFYILGKCNYTIRELVSSGTLRELRPKEGNRFKSGNSNKWNCTTLILL